MKVITAALSVSILWPVIILAQGRRRKNEPSLASGPNDPTVPRRSDAGWTARALPSRKCSTWLRGRR